MSKELSLENILSDGLGLVYDKTESEKQTTESFKDASLMDSLYSSRDTSHIKTLESLDVNFTKEKINLYKRLNKMYGKNKSKSLESYLYNEALKLNKSCNAKFSSK